MADDNTQQQPPPPQYDLQSLLGQLPQIPQAPQPDQTPVSQGWLSKLGEVLGGGMPSAMAAMSPADRNMAGLNALTDFSAGLMRASGNVHPGQTWMGNVGEALGGAQRGYLGSEGLSASMLGAKQEYSEEQYKDQLERLKIVLPQLQLAQAKALALGNPPATPPAGGAPSGSIAAAVAPFVAPNLPKDITPAEDQMVRTVYGEARGEPVVGQQGVASVIKNRMTAGNQSAQDVIFTPNAFQPWNDPKTRSMLEKLDPADPQYQAILNKAVRPVMAGDAKDPTGGATNFYSPTALDAQKLPIPSWAAGQQPSQVIGGHQFYKLPYGAPQTSAGGPPAGGAPVAPAAVPAVPVARPGGVPVAPPGTIQGVPGDTGGGGAQVAGPGAQAGRIAPPGPAVPGDVNAIIAGMKGAGAAPATLAPGAATAGPTAPTAVAAAAPIVPATPQPPAPTPTAPGFTYTRQPLPPDIQARIDHPLPPEQLQQLNADIAGATTPEALTSATKARGDAIAAARKDAIAQGETWQQSQQTLQADLYKKQQDIQQLNETAAATRAQEERMAVINNANTRLNAEADKQGARNGDIAKTYGTARDAGMQVLGSLDQLKPILTNLPEGAGRSIWANEGTRSIAENVLGWADTDIGKFGTSIPLFEQGMQHIASTLSPLAPAGTEKAGMVSQYRAQLPTLSQSPEGRELALQYVQDLARNQVDSMNWITQHKEDPEYFNKRLGVPDYDKVLLGMQNAPDAPKMPKMPPIPSSFDPTKVTDADRAAQGRYLNSVKPGQPYYAWQAGEGGRLHATRYDWQQGSDGRLHAVPASGGD